MEIQLWTWRKMRGCDAYQIFKGKEIVDVVARFKPGILVEKRNQEIASLQNRIANLESRLRLTKRSCHTKVANPICETDECGCGKPIVLLVNRQ